MIFIMSGYKRIVGQYNNIQENRRRSIWKNDSQALTKTLGHVQCPQLRKLSRLWSTPNEWIIATDGGLKDGVGTSSVVLYNVAEKEEMCTATSAEYCSLNQLDSTREIMRDNLMAEVMLNQLNDAFGGDTEQTVRFVGDSKNALTKMQSETQHPLGAEFDLKSEIRTL